MGVQILCAQYRGRGDSKSMRALFDSAILLLGMVAIAVSAGFFFGRAGLATILGAQGHAAVVLQEYIAGYSFSIIGQALYPLLLWFLNFNGNDKISKTSIAIMVVLNFSFDMLFAVYLDMGAFGLDLATSLSYLLTCAYVFREFIINYGWDETTFATIRWRDLFEAAKIGKPSLTFNIGVTLKSYIMNLTLLSSVGTAAIMVMSVQGTVCGMLGALPAGHADAFGSMGGVHYASKDRTAFVKTARFALKSCIIFSSIAMLSLMFAADNITAIYFKPTEEAWNISERMLWLFPSFLVLNGICGIFMRAYNLKEEYRTQHKDAWLVDGMPLFENVMMALLSAAAMPLIGSDAVWLAFSATELICIAIIACTVFKNAGRVTFKLDDRLKMNDDFDKIPTLERSFNSVEEVATVSEDVVNFCKANRVKFTVPKTNIIRRRISASRSTKICISEFMTTISNSIRARR